jgi:hypothetical protein
MQIINFSLQFVLGMSLLAPAAMAENLSVPDKDQRQGMSYEEYATYREKMRKHMEERKLPPEERRQPPESPRSPPEKLEKPEHNSAYGQGYQSRKPSEDRPDSGIGNRPDRPRSERFNRGNMGRR